MAAPNWCDQLLRQIERTLNEIAAQTAFEFRRDCGIHLAILTEPYMSALLAGKKTVESRFGVQMRPPHYGVAPMDLILLKRQSGPVTAVCSVKKIWCYDLTKTPLEFVRRQFARALCAEDPTFWVQRSHTTLATLMLVDRPIPIAPIDVQKRDRRGWVMLRSASTLRALEE
jgi:hypothetical protein